MGRDGQEQSIIFCPFEAELRSQVKVTGGTSWKAGTGRICGYLEESKSCEILL